jgi:hypothetical protein
VVEVYGNGALQLAASPLAAHAERVETSGETVFFYTRHARTLLQALEARPAHAAPAGQPGRFVPQADGTPNSR